MRKVKSMTDVVEVLQEAWDQASPEQNKSELLDAAAKAGSQMWMSCTQPKELKPYVEGFTDLTLRRSFLTGLSRVINAPNNQDSLIASNLRPYVKDQINLTHKL